MLTNRNKRTFAAEKKQRHIMDIDNQRSVNAMPPYQQAVKTDRNRRESNIELLRIVAMLMIVTHHVVINVSNTYCEMYLQRSCEPPFYLYNALVIYGVNLFVMISGYCGIRATLSKGVALYLKCVLYGMLGIVVYLLTPNNAFVWGQLEPYIYVLSGNTTWWFIRYYMFLFALSPFINIVFERCSRKEVYTLTLLLTILSVYFGWMRHDMVNLDGYNFFNFVWIYCIGHCIRLSQPELRSIRYVRWYALLLWVVCVVLTAWGEYHHWSQAVFGYNNPFIVGGTIGLFVFFQSFEFQSKTVNLIAASTLGVYLIHGHFQIGPFFINYAINHYTSAWQIPLFALGIFVICSVVAIGIDALTSKGLRWIGDKTTTKTAAIAFLLLATVYVIVHA